jgi:hypothetical protein
MENLRRVEERTVTGEIKSVNLDRQIFAKKCVRLNFSFATKKKRHKPGFAPFQPSGSYAELVIVVIVVVVAMAVVIMILVAAMIAVMIFIPTVIMFYATAFAFPVAVVETFAVVTRTNPAGAGVRRT